MFFLEQNKTNLSTKTPDNFRWVIVTLSQIVMEYVLLNEIYGYFHFLTFWTSSNFFSPFKLFFNKTKQIYQQQHQITYDKLS